MTQDKTKSALLLIDAWLDGSASEAQADALSHAVQADKAIATLLADRAFLHNTLQRRYRPAAPKPIQLILPQKPRWFQRAAVAAAILVVGLSMYFLGCGNVTQTPQQPVVTVPAKPNPGKPAPSHLIPAIGTIATVVDSLNTGDFTKGEVLRPGDYVLDSGYLQIVLHDGTNLLFEASAEFTLLPTTKNSP